MRNLTPDNKEKLQSSAQDFINNELDVLVLSRPMDGNYRIKKTLMVSQDQIQGKLEIVITYTPS